MGGLDDDIKTLIQSLVAFQCDHLGPGDHDVANTLVRNVHHPFEHIARIFIDKVVLPGITDQLQQFVAVFWFTVEKLAQ
ncbi:hypothetical protein D3C73_1392510 [compost metagenome]